MHSIDIYKVINGQYETKELVETIEFENEDLFCMHPKLIKFCSDNNVYADDDVLRRNDTKAIKFVIK